MKPSIDLLKPYFLEILTSLDDGPKRFMELAAIVKNKRTLTQKLIKLQDYRLVEYRHGRNPKGYTNYYTITKRGKEIIRGIKKLAIS